ncbi:MAG TPA: PD-(D/E)XK nuclease family protein [Actinomycetota bacterium]|jgi:putative RecB family exonuclease|nr:PD-(D/E)XK nuclease family protein [Actinomycetota bacterium]
MDGTLLKLSPSSARDFKSCPRLFKYRAIDRLPEPVSPAAARGSLVHAVLERLFAEPAANRTPERAADLLEALWREVRDEPEIRPAGVSAEEEAGWLANARRLLGNLFVLEDPRALTASKLEWWVEYELPDVHLRGIIDRLEERADGSWVLTDYKTGRVPGTQRELAAFFGLRFYALVCWRAFGVVPAEIRLVYLADPSVLTLTPNEPMLRGFERQMQALGKAIRRAHEQDDWRPSPSPLCMSCSFQDRCPAWSPDASG